MSDVTYTREELWVDGAAGEAEKYETPEFGIEIELRCTHPGCPARLYGPPENCYPAEPAEFEITVYRLEIEGAKHLELTPDQFRKLFGKKFADKMEKEAEDYAGENYEPAHPDD